MRPLFIFVFSLLIFNSTLSQFNVDEYNNFLQSHQNMTTEELLNMHPAGSFLSNINADYEDALYFDSLDIFYQFTDYEKQLLEQHGFLVSERLSKISFGEAIMEIFHNDLPVFVSSDAILHAFHISYDRILQDMEIGLLQPRLIELLNGLRNSMPELHNRYSAIPEMEKMLKDVDVYLTVPLKLLQENVNPYYPENNSIISDVLSYIETEEPDTLSLFSSNCKVIDWSQFKPRGHYVYDPELPVNLEHYFRAMMWLGRIELYLIKPSALPGQGCSKQTFIDIRRQSIDALLINELFEISSGNQMYEEIEHILKFFVGESDNVTLENLDFLTESVSIDSASQLLDSLKMVEFQDTLSKQEFAQQLILSQILYSNPMNPDSIKPASAFLLFGQRFVIDSYVTASVVYDRIKYLEQSICRLFPSTLDVLFSLGNDASAQLLIEELDNYHYSSNLTALRYLIDHYDLEFWESSIYNYWLNSIRKLNPPAERVNLPIFMQTAAYWQQKMNTQLSSWTELRHDNLLYAKQSYTGGTICSYPFSFVEPFPEFYENLNTLGNEAYTFFSELDFPDPYRKQNIIDYFEQLMGTTDTLTSIADKELAGEQFTTEEVHFLRTMLYDVETSGETINGWYSKLFYDDVFRGMGGYEGLMQSDHIVADIHTTPTDCGGSDLGAISHVGTGNINLGVVITENNLGELTAFVGPVMSYYEYRTTNYLRLNDEEWDNTYLQSALRPDWVNVYLADINGESRGNGPVLITSIEEDEDITIPQSELLISNYPNPFNPSTVIAFTIPRDLTNSVAELIIYNINGEVVKRLVKKELPSGNYAIKWNGDNDKGNPVSSGVYIYNLTAGNKMVSGKMNLIK